MIQAFDLSNNADQSIINYKKFKRKLSDLCKKTTKIEFPKNVERLSKMPSNIIFMDRKNYICF